MQGVPRTWLIGFELSANLEVRSAHVALEDAAGRREIIRTHPGPFDSPEDILSTYMQLIEHAEWKGGQLRLPDPSLQD